MRALIQWSWAALALLAFGTAGPAHAQGAPPVQCSLSGAVPPQVRSTGLAELVGDITIACTGGTPTGAGQLVPTVNIAVFLNTNITSRYGTVPSGSMSEALLFLDDPAPGAQFPCVPAQGVACPALGNGVGSGYYGPQGNANVFNGYQSGNNQIVFLGVPFDAPGIQGGTRVIRIKNIRAAIASLGFDPTNPSNNQVVAFISFTNPPANLSLNNPQATVAYVAAPVVAGFINREPIDRNVTVVAHKIADVRFVEGFASALKQRTPTVPPAAPGAQDDVAAFYQTESGFFAPTVLTVRPTIGLADSGTYLEVAFTNVVANVTLEVGAPTGPGTFAVRPIDGAVPDGEGHIVVPISGGAGSVRWEVTTTNINSVETITIPVYESHNVIQPPARGTINAFARLGPVDNTNTASPTAPLPRFTDPSGPTSLFVNGGPPIARAGPDQSVTEGDLITLDGSASTDPDNDTLTYTWRIISPNVVELPGDGPTRTGGASEVGPAGQDFIVELTVSDGHEGSSTDTMIVHVADTVVDLCAPAIDRCDAAGEAYVYVAIATSAGPKYARCWSDLSLATPTLTCALDGTGALALTDGEPLCLGDDL